MLRGNNKICIVTTALPDKMVKADIVHMNYIIKLFEPFSREVYIISNNLPKSSAYNKKIKIINLNHHSNSKQLLLRTFQFITMQAKIGYQLIKIRKNVDIVVFSLGGATLFIAMLFARLLKKKIVLLHPGVGVVKEYAQDVKGVKGNSKKLYLAIVCLFEHICCLLSHKIVMYTSNYDNSFSKRYRDKISINGSRFYVDNNHFCLNKNLRDRDNLVGYVGKFYASKGVMNFVKSIPLVLNKKPDTKFILCGDGPLLENINQYIGNKKLVKSVKIINWIPNEDIPKYLNEMKTLVIASDSEVGPQILLEAIACGTPVLSTAVGIVPNIIVDNENGFILENNSTECIYNNVIRVLDHPNLDLISKNGKEVVDTEYSHAAAVERYNTILEDLDK